LWSNRLTQSSFDGYSENRVDVVRISNLRWWIGGLLAAASGLAYVDRQTLPIVIAEIQKTIRISDQQFAHLQFVFLLAYGIMYAGGGRITDALGTRWGYIVFIVWWSTANLLQGAVSTFSGLALGLFLLGMGEGGCFPAASKAISEWFPAKERSIAFGIFNAGSGLGATLAPPFIAAIILTLNWRCVFFITGAMGFVWAAFWLRLYFPPSSHKRLTEAEREHLRETRAPESGAAEPISWIGLFRYRQLWGMVGAKVLSDSAWFFLISWLPKYLYDVRHLNTRAIGYYAWIPYAWAAIGSLVGGWLSSYLIRRNLSVDASRKICLGISAACMPVSLLISISPLAITIVFFSLAMMSHQFWSTIIYSAVTDIFPTAIVGSVSGLLGSVGAFGGMLLNLVAGLLLGIYHNYVLIFVVLGLLHPVSFVIILAVVRRIEPIGHNRRYLQMESLA
jgi:MFS transporter, ACS family, aldohexuronate transporter